MRTGRRFELIAVITGVVSAIGLAPASAAATEWATDGSSEQSFCDSSDTTGCTNSSWTFGGLVDPDTTLIGPCCGKQATGPSASGSAAGGSRGTPRRFRSLARGDATCSGRLQLRNRIGTARRPDEAIVYGTSHFSVPAHQTVRVKVRLDAAGKRLLKRRRRVKFTVKATVAGQVTTTSATLRHPNRRK